MENVIYLFEWLDDKITETIDEADIAHENEDYAKVQELTEKAEKLIQRLEMA